MSNSLTINTPNIVQQNTPLRNVPSGSTAEPDYNVKYVPQSLTEQQQAQARQNIGAAAAGETGGATINEFHYLRDTTTDPATYYIDADGYEPKEGDLITIVWDWPFRTDENDEAAFKNPATLKNNSTNPSIYIKNAHQMATDYDEIDPEVNTRWTVRLEKVDNVWYAYNISTAVQADWNTSDSTMPSYIKNKPTIPAAPVQSNWNETNTASLAYIQNKPNVPVLPIRTNNNLPILIPEDYYNMIAVECEVTEWGTDTEFSKSGWYLYSRGQVVDDSGSGNYSLRQGYNIFVKKAGDLTSTSIKFGYKAGNYKIKIGTNELWTQGTYFFTENTEYTGNITIIWGYHASDVYRHTFGGWKNCGLKLPICTSMYTYLMYNQWPKNGSDSRLYGNLVLVDKPFYFTGAETHDASLPNVTNVTAIYVPKARATEFASFMDYGYGSGNWSTIEAKVVYYDFLTWVDDMTPKPIVLPTLPLTMTDANSNVISGDFVAQNLTITPSV